MFHKLRKLLSRIASAEAQGQITRTCKSCGRTFTLPENVQHWPDCCQACRVKYRQSETVTRTCRVCGKPFTFPSALRRWPRTCRACSRKR